MKRVLIFLFLGLPTVTILAQAYHDFLGAGHQQGIVVTTSHNSNPANDGKKSIDGFPVNDPTLLADASRFLAQATMGYDYETIQMVAAMGHEGWLDEQLNLPRRNVMEAMAQMVALGEFGEDEFGMNVFRSAWWEMNLKSPDLLRQRINYALSQIFVVSAFGSDLFEDNGGLSGAYYDILGQHAFGNYRNLLSAISLSTSMGFYLSHFNNPKSDPANNIHPDENYAREVMQLFSIGLYELNNDGTYQLDANGQLIPTYNNVDIGEFAKIFTGFGDGRPNGSWESFDEDIAGQLAIFPMKMYEEWHEPGEKRLLNGQIVPAGQSGLADFNDAMDNLYQHPNVGPFIGKALIQFLVTSNPSPAYINRVANAFNDNGNGNRGDLQAVVKAILLDEEARNCSPLNQPTAGKLREPVLRYTGFLRAFNSLAEEQVFENYFDSWLDNTGQVPMYASSVFNFYLPTFQPNGPIANQNLVAPVFQIHNSSTSIGFVNEVDEWTFEDRPLEETPIDLNFNDELALAEDAMALVNRLDILLACGQLSENAKTIIANAVAQIPNDEEKVDLAVYLVLISPDYAILK
ncbi:MAG: DUF1800 domain-containing protein [Bacteroidota bacterium]